MCAVETSTSIPRSTVASYEPLETIDELHAPDILSFAIPTHLT